MMLRNKLLPVFVMLLIQQVVAAQHPIIAKYLPDNTTMLMSLNPVKIAQKIPGEDFRRSFIYREIMKKDDQLLQQFFSDPSSSGIDFSTDLVFGFSSDSSTENPAGNFQIYGVLKDEAVFAATINKFTKGETEIKTYGTNKILSGQFSSLPLAWNDEVFVISSGNQQKIKAEWASLNPDTSTVTIDSAGNWEPDSTSQAVLNTEEYDQKMELILYNIEKIKRENFFALLTPRYQPAVLTNPYVKQLMNEPGDIKIWNNGSGFNFNKYKSMMPKMLSGIFSKLQSITGTNKISVINFEEGKISAITRNYVAQPVADIYKKYPAPVLSTALTDRLPGGKLLVLFASSYNPEMAKEMMQATGLTELIDSIRTKLPFDPALLTASFKQDMMLAVLKKESNEVEETDKFGGIEIIFAIPIADQEKFNKLKQSFSHLIDSVKNTDKAAKKKMDIHPYTISENGLFVMASSAEAAHTYLQHAGPGATPDWVKEYASSPMLISINIQDIAELLMGKKKGVHAKKTAEQMNAMLGTFDKIVITGGKFENGAVSSKAELQFSNKNENAFKLLFDLINNAAEMSEKEKSERRKAYDEEMKNEKNDEDNQQ